MDFSNLVNPLNPLSPFNPLWWDDTIPQKTTTCVNPVVQQNLYQEIGPQGTLFIFIVVLILVAFPLYLVIDALRR